METVRWVLFSMAVGFSLTIAGAGALWLGKRWWTSLRKQQDPDWPGWTKAEPLQRRGEDSWQARHRRKLDKHRLIPTRHQNADAPGSKVHRARIRTRREN